MIVECLLFCAVAQGPVFAAQSSSDGSRPEQQRVFRAIPLRELAGVHTVPRLPPLGNFLPYYQGIGWGPPMTLRDAGTQRLDDVVALISDELGAATEEEGFRIETVGTDLMVAGRPETVQRAAAMARYLEAALTRPIRVTAALYRADQGAELPGTVAPGRLPDLVAGLTKVWEASAVTVSGEAVGLGSEIFTPYVRDYDTEVSEEAKIGDPKVVEMFEGVRVVVQPHALGSSEDIVAYAQVAVGDRRGPIEARGTGSEEFGSIDTPLLENYGALISGRVRPGGALAGAAVGDLGGGGRVIVAITCEHAGDVPQPPGRTRVYPASALVISPFQGWLEATGHVNEQDPAGLLPLYRQEISDSVQAIDPEALLELARDALGEKGEAEGTSLFGVRSHLAVRGDADVHDVIRGLFERFETQWLRTVEVRLTTRVVDDTDRVLHRLTFPALLGRPHFAMRGLETTTIRDNDVEIATKAEIGNPIVVPVFAGLCCAIEPYATQSGLGARVRCDLATVSEPTRRPKASDSGTDLYLVQTRRSEFSRRGALEPGQAIVLGDGPAYEDAYGTRRKTVQVLEVRSR